jgi:sulfur relay (sulfurtransferase) DsrF/TusC family protein
MSVEPVNKKVLFVIEESPTAHLRHFEAMRMALGFSVTHSGMKILLRGRGVLALREVHPELIGLPPELLEVLPLLGDLSVGILVEAESLSEYLPDWTASGIETVISRSEGIDLILGSDLVLGFWSPGRAA